MSHWTETAILKALDGKFFQLQQKSLGTFCVIDLNEPEEEPEPAPVVVPRIIYKRPETRSDGTLWLGDIERVVCAVFGVEKAELESPRRSHKLVEARQVFFWLAKKYTSHSFPLIGEWFGRDHTTVLYAVDKIDNRFSDYRTKIEVCVSHLGVSLKEKEAA